MLEWEHEMKPVISHVQTVSKDRETFGVGLCIAFTTPIALQSCVSQFPFVDMFLRPRKMTKPSKTESV